MEAITRLMASLRGSLYCELRSALSSAFSPFARAPWRRGAARLAMAQREKESGRRVRGSEGETARAGSRNGSA